MNKVDEGILKSSLILEILYGLYSKFVYLLNYFKLILIGLAGLFSCLCEKAIPRGIP